MPLSKERMRARKRQDRFDKALIRPPTITPVKPNHTSGVESMPWDDGFYDHYYVKTQVEVTTTHYKVVELDADGNIIPDYD